MSGIERVLVLADVHADELALRAAWNDAHSRYAATPFSELWFLGDIFGRGPRPWQAWNRLMRSYRPSWVVAGNHDWGIIGKIETVETERGADGGFNRTDWEIIRLHQRELMRFGELGRDNDTRSVAPEIEKWPLVCAPRPGIYLIHGGAVRDLDVNMLRQPLSDDILWSYVWGYVKEAQHARYTLALLSWLATGPAVAPELRVQGADLALPRLALVGHEHRRSLYREGAYAHQWEAAVYLDEPYELALSPSEPALLSPGSVGFSREKSGERKASYAVLTLEPDGGGSVTFHAACYDRASVRKEMTEKRYPPTIIAHLRAPGEPPD